MLYSGHPFPCCSLIALTVSVPNMYPDVSWLLVLVISLCLLLIMFSRLKAPAWSDSGISPSDGEILKTARPLVFPQVTPCMVKLGGSLLTVVNPCYWPLFFNYSP